MFPAHSIISRHRLSTCLALLLLLFAQATLATHHHDVQDLVSHDCHICSELHNVKHIATAKVGIDLTKSPALFLAQPAALSPFLSPRRGPLPRAPPSILRIN